MKNNSLKKGMIKVLMANVLTLMFSLLTNFILPKFLSVKISKGIAKEDALGASIDVYKFSSDAGKAFFGKCAEYIEDKKELKMWSEVALNDILKDIEFRACPLVGRWLEIDNHDDLAAAEKLFAEEQ